MKMRRHWAIIFASLFPVLPALAQSGSGGAPGLGWNQGGQNATNDMPYVTISNQSALSQERSLAVSSPLTLTDAGANSTLTVGLGTVPLASGGTGATTQQGAVNAILNFSSLASGDMCYYNGTNWVRLAKGSNTDILTLAGGFPVWSPSSLGPANGAYLTVGADATLTDERAITAGTGLSAADGGAGSTYTLSVDTAVVATLTGAQTLTNKVLTSPVLGTSLVLDNGSNDITITWASSAARAHLIPDVADATFVMSKGDLAIDGLKTFSDLKLSGTTFKTASHTVTVPAATDTLVMLDVTQTLTNKTLTSPIIGTSLVLDQSTADYTISFSNPGGARAYTITDVGGSADFSMKTGAYTSGAVAYGNGNMIAFSGGGSDGQWLKRVSGAPAWTNLPAPFGGDGSDGAVTITTSSVSGPKQYNATTFGVTSSNTMTYQGPMALVINATGAATIDGTITSAGAGHGGGTAAPAGSLHGTRGGGPGGGDCSHSQSAAVGGGGGGCYGAGGRGGAASGTTFGSPGGGSLAFSFTGGSGGGGGSADGTTGAGGNGGAGAASIIINAVGALTVSSTGTITCTGSNGSNATAAGGGGGGAGAGGIVYLASQTSVTCQASSVVSVAGGTGGNDNGTGGGGGGGGGGIRIAHSPSNTLSGTTTTTAGSGGTGDQNGASGGAGTGVTHSGTPNTPLFVHMFGPGWNTSQPHPELAHFDQFLLLVRAHDLFEDGEIVVQQRETAWAAAQNDIHQFCYYNAGNTAVCESEGRGAVTCGELEAWKDAG